MSIMESLDTLSQEVRRFTKLYETKGPNQTALAFLAMAEARMRKAQRRRSRGLMADDIEMATSFLGDAFAQLEGRA